MAIVRPWLRVLRGGVTDSKLIIFDCDSTLSAIEGIDEMARLRGPEMFKRVEEMTRETMDGQIPVQEVFARRLAMIRPTRAEADLVGRRYVETVEPEAKTTIQALKSAGWTPLILSGGFKQAIVPLADYLGIVRIEAVELFFQQDGSYRGFDETFPTTRSGGKPSRIEELKKELKPGRVVMVGDGGTDLETKPVVDLFVGFGRYVERPKVKAGANHFAYSLGELPALLLK
ncbi:MAG TPA: HAD-IB family phosphatase [Opitutaceae bacterium]|nr:HAD-IB family phosphatase [Opitutaceae bacterium]